MGRDAKATGRPGRTPTAYVDGENPEEFGRRAATDMFAEFVESRGQTHRTASKNPQEA